LRQKAIDGIAIVKNIGKELEGYGGNISSTTIKEYNQALSKAKGALERTSKFYQNVKDHGERTFLLLGKTLWKWLDEEAKLKYIKKLAPKVKEYYKNIADEAEKKYKEVNKNVIILNNNY
jgi:hypothetical protein